MSRLPERDADPSEWASHTRDEWQALDGRYSWWTRRWRRTLDFLRGEHWNALQEFDEETLPSWKRFPLINFTLAFYNNYLSDFLQSDVRFSAVPASPDPSDRDAAELAEQLLKYLWDKLNFGRKRVDLAAWLIACGTGVLRIFWDTNTGDMVPLGQPTPNGVIPIDPETLEPDPSMDEPMMLDRGEIGVEVISPQYVRWARNPQDGVMLGLRLTYEEAKSLYGEDQADRLEYTEEHPGLSADLSRIEQPTGFDAREETTLVIEHYLPPSSEYPDGLWWTTAKGGTELLTGPWALPIGQIPIVSFRWLPLPGERNLGLSPLYDISFQNKTYEEIMARIVEWYNEVKPKVLYKAGGGLKKGDMNDKPWQELMVNAGAEPDYLDVPNAPSGLFNTLQQVQQDIGTTSGRAFKEQDRPSQGTSRQSVRMPGDLEEGGATAIAQINSKAAWEKVGEILLRYVANFYNESRVVAVQGVDKQFLWREFKGKDIESDGDLAATIKVDELPLLPAKRQSLRETVVGLLQSEAGQILFADEQGGIDSAKVEAAIQATGLDTHIDTLDPDTMEARNEEVEFRNLQQGQQPPQVQDWQNHQAHYGQHVKVLKSQRFKGWQPHQRQAFLQHVNETQQRMEAEAQERQQTMIEQERMLREVREQAELKANVQEEWATEMIGLISDTTGLEIEQIMSLVDEEGPQGAVEETSEAVQSATEE